MALDARALDVVKFAEARFAELLELKQYVEGNDGEKDVFKSSRHMRRRATSHKSYKMPTKLRMTSAPSKKAFEDRCRKHKRRPANIVQCSSKAKRLHLHVWNAKRMEMRILWGYELPWSRRDLGARATYKAVRDKCTVFDASYLEPIRVSGEGRSLIAVLRRITRDTDRSYASPQVCLGRSEATCVVVSAVGPVGPVRVLWEPLEGASEDNPASMMLAWTGQRSVLLWCHPSISAAVLELVKAAGGDGVQAAGGEGELCRFELRGKTAKKTLRGVLSAAGHTLASGGQVDLSDSGSDGFVQYVQGGPLPAGLGRKRAESAEGGPVAAGGVCVGRQSALGLAGGGGCGYWLVRAVSDGRGFGSGWDVVLPRRCPVCLLAGPSSTKQCVLPQAMWTALQLRGAAAIGQAERRYIFSEMAAPCFPFDHPETLAGVEAFNSAMDGFHEHHSRRPKAHRVALAAGAMRPLAAQGGRSESEVWIKCALSVERGVLGEGWQVFLPGEEACAGRITSSAASLRSSSAAVGMAALRLSPERLAALRADVGAGVLVLPPWKTATPVPARCELL